MGGRKSMEAIQKQMMEMGIEPTEENMAAFVLQMVQTQKARATEREMAQKKLTQQVSQKSVQQPSIWQKCKGAFKNMPKKDNVMPALPNLLQNQRFVKRSQDTDSHGKAQQKGKIQ